MVRAVAPPPENLYIKSNITRTYLYCHDLDAGFQTPNCELTSDPFDLSSRGLLLSSLLALGSCFASP